MIINEDEYLAHYGTPRHSGRYPWGSGQAHVHDTTRNKSFLENVDELRKQGMSEKEIWTAFGMSSTQYRARITMERSERKQAQVAQALKLHDKGLGGTEAAKRMGIPEPTYRTLIKAGAADKAKQLTSIADMLQREVDAPGDHIGIDVGSGNEVHLNVSKQRFDVALAMMKERGYKVHEVKVPQATTKHDTSRKVLTKPDVTQKDVWQNQDKIKLLTVTSSDQGRPESWGRNDYPPLSIHPDRVQVKWGDEGGAEKDGVLYVRPGVPDVSLDKSRYAQVRVKVGDGHFIKGMAMYNDNLPPGTDILFHSNKTRVDSETGKTRTKLDALKPLESDPALPFGTVIRRQIKSNDGTPNEKVTSAMNIVNEEGDWKKWSRNISAQALSKQDIGLARGQLAKTYESRKNRYDEIMALTNPVVREKLLESFADSTDRSAVHLKAAALDRQNWHVILPIETMKETEIYAPKYNNGERVVLIRYPHGGTFEIPELTVNNRHPEARHLLEGASDAVGIHHKVAERLSGADFDGDTVLVIPNNHDTIKPTAALEELKGFDAKRLYKLPEGQKFTGNKQNLMGQVSNLITDMTIKGASHREIAQAVKHSMVVIDAEKHDLDVKRSYQDQGIKALRERYQSKADPTDLSRGASTIISRASAREDVLDRRARRYSEGTPGNRGPINTETGALEWVPTGKQRRIPERVIPERVTKTGRVVPEKVIPAKMVDVKIQSKKLAETSDAHDLVSDANQPMERVYADHSNRLKALANQARLSQISTPTLKISSSAKKAYAREVESLNAKLAAAKRNSPLERQANAVAVVAINARKAANSDLKGDTLNKIRYQEIEKARNRVGAKKEQIKISDEEWNAIQAGAIGSSKLREILNNADLERVQELATPRPERMMTEARKSLAQQLLDDGYTKAEAARRVGVSVSTLELAISADDKEED